MSNYPAGAYSGSGRRAVEFRCGNEDCPGLSINGEAGRSPCWWEVEGIAELGQWTPYREEDCLCPECGEPGVQP